jgi:hypothetical protein
MMPSSTATNASGGLTGNRWKAIVPTRSQSDSTNEAKRRSITTKHDIPKTKEAVARYLPMRFVIVLSISSLVDQAG